MQGSGERRMWAAALLLYAREARRDSSDDIRRWFLEARFARDRAFFEQALGMEIGQIEQMGLRLRAMGWRLPRPHDLYR